MKGKKQAPPAPVGDGGAGTAGTKRVFEALSNYEALTAAYCLPRTGA
jgi:hypothetical protein